MDVVSKICSKCGVDKPLDDFNKQKLGKHGRRASCRECQNAENRAYKQSERGKELRREWKRSDVAKACGKRYREKNKEAIRIMLKREKYKVRKRVYMDEQRFGGNRTKALERDGYKCTSCGSDYRIQVHHIDEMGRNKPKEVQNNELNNLITLCAKCHIEQHNPVLVRWGKA